jgi:rfaE bifunctional protein kinase chain/domain
MIIGDSILDAYITGVTERLSPESKVPVLKVSRCEYRAGGAANVALNVKSLGARPFIFSVTGNDENSKILFELLNKQGVDTNGFITDFQRITTKKTRISGSNTPFLRLDEEDNFFISEEIEREIASNVLNCLEKENPDIILFVDYDKGVITPSLFKTIQKIATEKGIPIAADPKHRNFSMYRNIKLFKPNINEFCAGIKEQIKPGDIDKLERAIIAYAEKMNIEFMMVTLAELGVFVYTGLSGKYLPVSEIKVSDVSGAGDSVLSIVSLALLNGCTAEDIAVLSNIAGGLACKSNGVVPISLQSIKNELYIYEIG